MNNPDPSIAVVIPIHRMHDYLGPCIDSVLAQTLPAKQIVVVNDGGGDAINDYVKKNYPMCTLVDLVKNRGLPGARNAGVAHCKTDWLSFLDSDDLFEPSKLEREAAWVAASEERILAYHCGLQVFGSKGDKERYTSKPPKLLPEHLKFRNQVLSSSFSIHRELFDRLGGYDESIPFSEDYDFAIKLVSSGETIHFLPEALVRFRRDDHGNMSSNWRRILRGQLDIYRRNKDFYRQFGSLFYFRFLGWHLWQSAGKIRGQLGMWARSFR